MMFELDVRHLASTMLHPKFRQLRCCSQKECNQACEYIRDEINKIIQNDRSNESCIIEPTAKKTEKSILDQYEDLSDDESDLSEKLDDDIDSNVTDHKPTKADELTEYL